MIFRQLNPPTKQHLLFRKEGFALSFKKEVALIRKKKKKILEKTKSVSQDEKKKLQTHSIVSFSSHFNRGVVLQKLGKLEEALMAYKKAYLLNPQSKEARNNIEILLLNPTKPIPR